MEVRYNSDSDLRELLRDLFKCALFSFIFTAVFVGGTIIVRYYISKMEWDKLKNNCELSTTLNNGYYEYTCKIDSNSTTVIYDKLDSLHWKKFKIKNNCQLINIDLTVSKNTNQWSCNNNVTIYNDKN